MTHDRPFARYLRGTALLEQGFRPFFLLAGAYAVLAMVVWLGWMGLQLAGGTVPGTAIAFPLYQWHAHEMLFGFYAAALAGFLLTAVPNWTGEPGLSGGALLALVAVWLAGRLAIGLSAFLPPALVALADLAFLPLLGLAVALPLVRARKLRNLVFLVLLAVLVAANALAHMEFLGLADWGTGEGHLLAIDLVVLLITIVGGRIVPAFTANWLAARGDDARLSSRPWLDRLTIAVTAAVLVADLVGGWDEARGALALAAATLHALRLAGWRTSRTLSEPILWVLHLGYSWLVLGFALKALALLTGALPEIAALHAFTAGAASTMVLGVMTRAALGHSGRPLEAAPATVLAYALVTLGALVRVAGPVLAPHLYLELMLVSGAAWALAFALFVAVHWPIMTRPRVDQAIDLDQG